MGRRIVRRCARAAVVRRVGRVGQIDTIGHVRLNPAANTRAGARRVTVQVTSATSVGVLHDAIVERCPSLGAGQQIVRVTSALFPGIDDNAAGGFHVEPEAVVAQGLVCRAYKSRTSDQLRPTRASRCGINAPPVARKRRRASAIGWNVFAEPGQHAADIGDNHVQLAHPASPRSTMALNELDPIGAPIRRCDLSRHLDGIVRLNGVDAGAPQSGRPIGEDTGCPSRCRSLPRPV